MNTSAPTSTNTHRDEQRLIILDTETTGINPREGHRIVEIGCVEMINRQLTGRNYHVYINPQKEMEQEVIDVHGLTNDFLQDKPLFHQVANDFIEFIKGATLVIHNAKFDVGFMDHEFALVGKGLPKTADICSVIDTLKTSKDEFGSPKTLDFLAKHYRVDKLVDRTYHGALIDAQLLAFVYVEMTRKQETLNLSSDSEGSEGEGFVHRIDGNREALKIVYASAEEITAHNERLALIKSKGSDPIWP